MRCPYCGIENPEHGELCSACGETMVIHIGQGVDEGNLSRTWFFLGFCLILASILAVIYFAVDLVFYSEDPLNLVAVGMVSLICLAAGVLVLTLKRWTTRFNP